MVSKRKALGKASLVLVTLGTTAFSSRILPIIKRIKAEHTVVSTLQRPDKLIHLIRSADKIICHAGPATLFLITKYAKTMPLIIPRRENYKEHVNDHQLHYALYIQKKLPSASKHYVVSKDEKLEDCILKYLKENKRMNILRRYIYKDKDGTKRLIHRLKMYFKSESLKCI